MSTRNKEKKRSEKKTTTTTTTATKTTLNEYANNPFGCSICYWCCFQTHLITNHVMGSVNSVHAVKLLFFFIAFSHILCVCLCEWIACGYMDLLWPILQLLCVACSRRLFSTRVFFLLCVRVLFCSFYFPFKRAFQFIKTYMMIKINKKRASICVRVRCAYAKCLLWSWAFGIVCLSMEHAPLPNQCILSPKIIC